MRRVLGKPVVGNKRCVPNQIEMKKRPLLHFRFLKTLGLAMEYQSSQFGIDDYLKLPNIKVIGLIRNGPAVVSSIMKRSEKTFRVAAYRWCRAIEVIYELRSRIPHSLLIVSYESLVAKPEENMQRVAAFLCVEYQDRMLEGPQYNPWYPEAGMIVEKINGSETHGYKLAERFPTAHRQYEQLLMACPPRSITPAHDLAEGKPYTTYPPILSVLLALYSQTQSVADIFTMVLD